jgi:hypothetical protein
MGSDSRPIDAHREASPREPLCAFPHRTAVLRVNDELEPVTVCPACGTQITVGIALEGLQRGSGRPPAAMKGRSRGSDSPGIRGSQDRAERLA